MKSSETIREEATERTLHAFCKCQGQECLCGECQRRRAAATPKAPSKPANGRTPK